MAFHRRNILFGIVSLPTSALLARHPLPGLTATVYNGHEFHTALQAAGPGSTIMLAPGNYGDIGKFILNASDISIRVQSPLHTIMRSALVVEGSFIDLDGLAFEEGIHLAGTGLNVSNSSFRGKGIDVTGVNTVVSNCEISFFTGRGITIKGTAKNPRIVNNYIHDARGQTKNGCEAIQCGQSMQDSNRVIGALIESNRLERVDAESEAMSIKSSGNIIRNNSLRNSKAYIVNRHGENNTYQGNVVEGAYGIVIHDRGNKVIGNRCVNTILRRSIRIMGGNISASSNNQGGHPQAMDTLVSGNTADYLVVGDQFPGHRLPAVNTTIQNHNGPVIIKAAVGTKNSGANVIDENDLRRGNNKKADAATNNKNNNKKNNNKKKANKNKNKNKNKKTKSAFFFLHGLDLSMFS